MQARPDDRRRRACWSAWRATSIAPTRDLKASYDTLQTVLDCCKPSLCSAFGHGERCTLSDLPTALLPQSDGKGIGLLGALAIASTTSELLLLEYADGKPAADVGWGRATTAQMLQTWRLHTEAYDLMQRTPYLARKMGSALLSRVAAAVTSARSDGLRTAGPSRARREIRRRTSDMTRTSGTSPA